MAVMLLSKKNAVSFQYYYGLCYQKDYMNFFKFRDGTYKSIKIDIINTKIVPIIQ